MSARYRRLVRRLGGRETKKKAAVALAHTMLRIVYYVLWTRQGYAEFGVDYGVKASETRERRLVKDLERLGYTVVKTAA